MGMGVGTGLEAGEDFGVDVEAEMRMYLIREYGVLGATDATRIPSCFPDRPRYTGTFSVCQGGDNANAGGANAFVGGKKETRWASKPARLRSFLAWLA